MLEHLPAPWSRGALVSTQFHRGAGPGVVSLPLRFLDHRLTKLLNLINYKKNISSEFVGDIYIYLHYYYYHYYYQYYYYHYYYYHYYYHYYYLYIVYMILIYIYTNNII
jgi:hypothetical protein